MIKPLVIKPVILCGGSGTRLWPLSRAGFPKQFLVLSGINSLFQQAVSRLNNLGSADIIVSETLVVTNEEHRFLVLEQLREMPGLSSTLILEPIGRNTAPALTLAALEAISNGEDPVLVVTPADQTVADNNSFSQSLQDSIRAASDGTIVILGIRPSRPETGFGYIKKTGPVGKHNDFSVEYFFEKPDLETATRYLASGDFTWNSGMFVVRASIWLASLKHFRPDVFIATSEAFSKRTLDANFLRPDPILFAEVPTESIDYAVMENCPKSPFNIKMVFLDAGWNDLGSWDAVWQVGLHDHDGNVTNGDTMLEDTANSLVYANHRLVTTVGVSNLVIIETADAVVVADRLLSQKVKKIVEKLESNGREERLLHRKVSRPWGWFDTIDIGERFKVKRIQVNPGASLSLQKHSKRAEHWVVVKGVAQVTCGEKTIVLHENQSTFIPLGELHRLSNPGQDRLEIIEVQSGSYLGEDDIVRLEDGYGRNKVV